MTKGADVISVTCTITSDAGAWVVLQMPKAMVVISRAQFIDGLQRGKAWKRHEAMAQREAAKEEG